MLSSCLLFPKFLDGRASRFDPTNPKRSSICLEMQDSRTPPFSEGVSNPAVSRKKKISTPKQLKGNDAQPSVSCRTGKKASKRNLPKEAYHLPHPTEISNSDSLPDSSSAGNEYRALRRKYLLLEEESFALERGLKEVEGEVKALEDEKLALLDRLVILEGLIDPSDSHHI